MATTTDSVTVLDHCQITPPLATAAAELSLPLTFMDMLWLHFSPIQRLIFYELPELSESKFVDRIVPELQNSLSLTLKYFLPLAGNLIIPPDLDSGMPEILYSPGNSVALIVAECINVDFNHLVTNVERDCAEFHPLIPELKSSLHHDDLGSVVSTSTPVLALQVTLFPNMGLSIGISNHHTIGDASSIFNFMKTWAIFHSKLSEVNDADADAELLVNEALPIFDKTLIKDPKGLAKILWGQWNDIITLRNSTTFKLTTKTNKVRRTFVISQKDVEKLKNLVLRKGGKLVHLSSFTVICSYAWTCLVKSRLASHGENVSHEGGENEHFMFAAECRERLDPPLPANYFGNCLTGCSPTATTEQLAGEEGFQVAVELMGRTIHEKLKRKDELFNGFETALETIKNLNWDKTGSVAGTTRYNYYNLDFGWRKPIKFEFISIDETGAISLNKCRGSDGDVEVGLSLTKPKMDAFCSIFMEGLNAL